MKNTRTFFFLKDSVTGKFYTGQNNWISGFEDAAVYFQRKNAEKKIKDLLNPKLAGSWTWYLEREGTDQESEVNLRKSLPNWGIEVVEIPVCA